MKKSILILTAAALALTGCGYIDEVSAPVPVVQYATDVANTTAAEVLPVTTLPAVSTAAVTTAVKPASAPPKTSAAVVHKVTASKPTKTTAAETEAAEYIYNDNNNYNNEAAEDFAYSEDAVNDAPNISAKTTVTTAKPKATTTKATRPIDPDLPIPPQQLANMTLHEKVCQMFIVAPESLSKSSVFTKVDSNFRKKYEEYPVGGFIFFAYNIVDAEQTKKMVMDVQKTAKDYHVGAFISVDEEGGIVARLHEKLDTPAVNNMRYYGDLNDYDTAYAAGETIGEYLWEYGFNLDFAPVADVNLSSKNELGSRIFSSDPEIVAAMSAAVIDGLHSYGVYTTLKHFPGLGAGNGNTHNGAVSINRTYEQLCKAEFPAFRGGIEAGADFVMVGHQITNGAGDDVPGDLSRTVVTDWLRGDLGFEGLVITDSQSMGAITNYYTSGEAAVRAVEAGIDIILMPKDLAAAVKGVEDAVKSGRISEKQIDATVLKILEKKASSHCF